jgi:8-oxo-dGTP diphosphatase
MHYTHCPHCGTPYADPSGPNYHCHHCGKYVFLNSSPTASTLIVEGDKVLLGKRSKEPSLGMWDIIGGFLDYGEHPHDAAIREAKEETGYDVEIVDQLGIFMDVYGEDKPATLNICFTANIIGGVEQPNDDIGELRWFSVNDLPNDIAFENGRRMLDAWRAQQKH